MVVEAEETPVPDGGHVVGEVAVQEALVQEGDAGFVDRVQLAFDPGDALGVGVCGFR